MNELPRYRCHKIVRAIKVEPEDDGDVVLRPTDPQYQPISVSRDWYQKRGVVGTGYYVVYDNGYTSWSPVEAFEKGYTPLTDENCIAEIDGRPVRFCQTKQEAKEFFAGYEFARTRFGSRIQTLIDDNNALRSQLGKSEHYEE